MSPTLTISRSSFIPGAPLIDGRAVAGCRASVTIPARNEEATLPSCLDALAAQVDLDGDPLPGESFEILLLLNNCTDRSAEAVYRWRSQHPLIALHVAELDLPTEAAHAGTARRLLMDTASQRLGGKRQGLCAILATDADSTVARDWLAQNLAALERGADAVGGLIELREEDLAALPEQVRCCYRRDRRYAALIAQLEDLLDPQPEDPFPRHLDHFGSSLACTPEAYARAGGMPPVSALEDEAFVDRLRRADLRLRHEPAVRVFTSARLQGRASVGLAGQLRQWSALPGKQMHCVQSSDYLVHRFRWLRRLRSAFALRSMKGLPALQGDWRNRVQVALRNEETIPAFLLAIDCNGLIEASFVSVREQPIDEAIQSLERFIRQRTRVADDLKPSSTEKADPSPPFRSGYGMTR